MDDYPAFDDAIDRFRRFLDARQIVWLIPDDVALVPPRLYARWPHANNAEASARARYEEACRMRLGIELGVICQLDDQLGCFVYAPSDEEEASCHQMPDGLKLSRPEPIPVATGVDQKLRWRYLAWRSRRWQSRKLSLFHVGLL
jgi:hypothetical protein